MRATCLEDAVPLPMLSTNAGGLNARRLSLNLEFDLDSILACISSHCDEPPAALYQAISDETVHQINLVGWVDRILLGKMADAVCGVSAITRTRTTSHLVADDHNRVHGKQLLGVGGSNNGS